MSDDLLTAGVELKGYVTTLLGNLEKDVDGQFDKWCAPVTGPQSPRRMLRGSSRVIR